MTVSYTEAAFEEYVAAISKIIAPENLLRDITSRVAYGTNASCYQMVPKLVVRVNQDSEMVSLFAAARYYHIPLTIRAAGTSLSGQAVTEHVLVVLGDGYLGATITENGRVIRLKTGVIGQDANRLLAPFGRKIGPDPASISAAKIGGIVANNSSGMCCGTHANSYQTLKHMRVILPSGEILDTADPDSIETFRTCRADLLDALQALSWQIKTNPEQLARVQHKYRLKNTTGYGINALIDFDDPVEMLTHLMIGSEGTLGFVSQVTLKTVVDHPYKASALILFASCQQACEVTSSLNQRGLVEAVELMDSKSIISVQNKTGLPDFLYQSMHQDSTCLLIELSAADLDQLTAKIKQVDAFLVASQPIAYSGFSSDKATCERYWIVRKGLLPAIGGARSIGSSVIIEDVAFPIEHLAAGVNQLRQLFAQHGYHEAILFGHALEGNLHFCFTPRFETAEAIARFDNFMQDLSTLLQKYDGSFKAEHGTGRNAAPFVQAEWGTDLYGLMQKIKTLFDPDAILNPDVIISQNPQIHLAHLKQTPMVHELVDHCIECGFCEPACPSHGLTLSPRQRISVQRYQAQLRLTDPTHDALKEIAQAYHYRGVQSCAKTGMCATRCPVGINTGELMRELMPAAPVLVTKQIAQHFKFTTQIMRLGLGVAQKTPLKRWIYPLRILPAVLKKGSFVIQNQVVESSTSPKQVVYFTACMNRVFAEDKTGQSLAGHTLNLFKKSGISVIFPDDIEQLCCGQPFKSKKADLALEVSQKRLNETLLQATNQGKLPVYIDNISCAETMLAAQAAGQLDKRLQLYHNVEFLKQFVLPHLKIAVQIPQISLHTPCSARKIGAEADLFTLTQACAQSVLPTNIDCCGFAGDKGLLMPELNQHALRFLPAQLPASCQQGVSVNRMCQVGLTAKTGIAYQSIEALLDQVSNTAT